MSPAYIGGTKITAAYVGSTAIRSIHLGNTIVWPELAEYTQQFTAAGVTNVSTFVIPWWAEGVDIIALGGGGAGGVGGGIYNGGGGGAGEWAAFRLYRTSFPADRKLTITVGSGGLPTTSGGLGPNPAPTAANDGSPSNVAATGMASVVANGGKADVGRYTTHNGYSPGNYTFQGKTYVGGAGGSGSVQATPDAGQAPGAGGNGSSVGLLATNGKPGGAGARGQVWIRVLPP